MKTQRMILAALCGVAMLIGTSSCKKEKQENENEGEMMRIEVSVGGTDGNTKTHLVHDENKYKVAWDNTDAFMLYTIDGTNGSSFRFSELTEGSDGTTAIFEGRRPGAAPFFGCYPSGKVSCEDDGVYEFTIDETQAGNPETVDEQTATANAGPMVGYMKDAESGLVFQNVMSWLKVGLKGNVTIKRIVLTDEDNKPLNGTLTVTCNDEGGNFTFTSEMDPDAGTNKLVIVSNEGFQLKSTAPTYFWFQVPAGSLENLELDAYLDVDGLTKVLELTNTISGGVSGNTVLTAEVNSPITATEATVTMKSSCSNNNIYQLKATVTGKDAVFTTYMVGVCYNYADGEDPTIDNCVGHQEIGTFPITNGGVKSIIYDLVGLESGREYKIRAYATNGVYAYSNCMKIDVDNDPLPLPREWNENGGKNTHPFTVGSGKVVYFSQGNLQYIGSAETPYWQFAEHQFDFIGDEQNGSSSNIDRDLFGWGDLTGCNISGNEADYPWTDDWGTKIGTGWRTLTGGVGGEWDYLINTRKKDGNLLYGEGKVGNCTPGLIILPDDWSCPDDLTFRPGRLFGFETNFYSCFEWAQMEAAGAVFLPAAGYRTGAEVGFVGSHGNYWSSSSPNDNSAYILSFVEFYPILIEFSTEKNMLRYHGFSVRLVSDDPPVGR